MKGERFIVAYEDKHGSLHLESSKFTDHNQAVNEARTYMMNAPFTDFVVLKEINRFSHRPEKKFAKCLFETPTGGNFRNL